MDNRIIVICTHCGTVASWDHPRINHPFGIYHWRKPCKTCSTNAWAAHESNRDWKTGRKYDSTQI